MSSETIGAELIRVEKSLEEANILSPRRHAELILQSAINLDRTSLYLNARNAISDEKKTEINKLLKRRLEGEPIQYITGWAPFYGRKLEIYDGVFIPRFDTELLIERFLVYYNSLPESVEIVNVLDLCCGSGAIGLTIAAEAPKANVTLIDISRDALECTQSNAKSFGVEAQTKVLKWDALKEPPEDWTNHFNCIVANPPYIPVSDMQKLHPDVQQEPHTALTDGGDGLKFYRHWIKILPVLLIAEGYFLTEIGDNASEDVSRIIAERFDAVEVYKDLSGLVRVVEGRSMLPERM